MSGAKSTEPTARAAGLPGAAPGCPCCGQPMRPLYWIDGIPIHSTIQLADRDEALRFPSGDLTFSFCPACAFVANTRYDPSVQDYSTNCEESQHASPTFSRFALDLASRWIDRFDIRNKAIIEIGCGKGEFLTLLCELGNNRGIGIDPSYQPWRNASKASSRMRFINALYSEAYAELQADVILCRHTLEHIGRPLEFVQMIRRAIGDRRDMLVLFELPDVTRILQENAFWDVYYEHSSYFSPGSLARLFRASHFDILDLQRTYGDQYLLIAAKPLDGPSPPSLELEGDLPQMRVLAERFKEGVNSSALAWRERILAATARGQKIVLWSALSKAVAFLTTLKLGDAIEYAVDINPQRQGKFLPGTGQQIMPPEFLADYRPDLVILMNPVYIAEVQQELDRLAVKATILPVGSRAPG